MKVDHRKFAEWVGLSGPPPANDQIAAFLRELAMDERDAIEAHVFLHCAALIGYARSYRRDLIARVIWRYNECPWDFENPPEGMAQLQKQMAIDQAEAILLAFPQPYAGKVFKADIEKAAEIVSAHPLICGACGGPLPNEDCGHGPRGNNTPGSCVPSKGQPLEQAISAALTDVRKDYEEVLADKRRLTRELDVAMHGEAGAAKQASLCDLIEPAKRLRAALDLGVAHLTAIADNFVRSFPDSPGAMSIASTAKQAAADMRSAMSPWPLKVFSPLPENEAAPLREVLGDGTEGG